MHKSLLPLHSGANPIFWTILNNTPAGHTIHKMNDKIDAGEIILQKKVRYDLSFDARGLYEKVEKEQIKDFFKFITRPNFYLKRPKKNKFNKKNYHFIENFKKFKKVNFFFQKKYWNTISLLRALTFQHLVILFLKLIENSSLYQLKLKLLKNLKRKIMIGLMSTKSTKNKKLVLILLAHKFKHHYLYRFNVNEFINEKNINVEIHQLIDFINPKFKKSFSKKR